MLRLFPLFLLLSSCTVAGHYPMEVPSSPPLGNVVALVNEDGEAYCTGFMVWGGIVTAAHCVDTSEEVWVGTRQNYANGYWDDATSVAVIRVDEEADLALLAWYSASVLPLAANNPNQGEEVVAVGHALGVGYVTMYGHVSSMEHEIPGLTEHPWILVDPGVIPGMSGGPVLNARGEVVGVCVFYIGTPHMGGMVPVNTLRNFLEE